jgi:O-antigen/teichoic acid export membrane protein
LIVLTNWFLPCVGSLLLFKALLGKEYNPFEICFDSGMTERTSNRIINAAKWLFLFKSARATGDILIKLYLAQALLPKDFGVFSIAMLFIGALEALSKPGWQLAMVQKRRVGKEEENENINIIWTINIIKGFAVSVVILLFANSVARFFKVPETENVLFIMCISPLIGGFRNPQQFRFMRDFDFKTIGVVEFLPALINYASLIIFVFILGNVFALALGSIVHSLAAVLISFIIFKKPPRISFRFRKASYVVKYGSWVMLDRSVSYIVNNAEIFIIGLVLGPISLGVYGFAKNIGYRIYQEIINVAIQTFFPAFTKAQEDRNTLLRVLGIMIIGVSVLFPLTSMMGVYLTPYLINYVGEKWSGAVDIIPLCLVAGTYFVINRFVGESFLRGIGLPEKPLIFQGIKSVLFLLCTYYLGRYYGLEGVVWAILITEYLLALSMLAFSFQRLSFRLKKQIGYLLILTITQASWLGSHLLSENIGITFLLWIATIPLGVFAVSKISGIEIMEYFREAVHISKITVRKLHLGFS